MPQVISLRLPDATAQRLRTAARRAGRTLNEWGALSLEEWLRQGEFADIEFRGVGAERPACLQGALPVWQVVMVAHSHGMDAEATARHFGWPPRRVRAALNYYEAYPEEIDRAIEDNRAMTEVALRRLLPQMETFEVGTVEVGTRGAPAPAENIPPAENIISGSGTSPGDGA